MGNFEKLGILVIIILVVVILVLAVWGMGVPPDEQGNPFDGLTTKTTNGTSATGDRSPGTDSAKIELDTPSDEAEEPIERSGGGLDEWIRRDDETARDLKEPEPKDVENGEEAAKPIDKPVEPAPEKANMSHTVEKGDMLVRLSRKYYGNERYWTVLRDANPNVNPDALALGTVLVIPHPDKVLSRTRSAVQGVVATNRAEEAKAAGRATYTVRKGDTLSSIALKTLGTKEKWRSIYTTNRAKIGADPDRLPEGLVLAIP